MDEAKERVEEAKERTASASVDGCDAAEEESGNVFEGDEMDRIIAS